MFSLIQALKKKSPLAAKMLRNMFDLKITQLPNSYLLHERRAKTICGYYGAIDVLQQEKVTVFQGDESVSRCAAAIQTNQADRGRRQRGVRSEDVVTGARV